MDPGEIGPGRAGSSSWEEGVMTDQSMVANGFGVALLLIAVFILMVR